MKSAPNYASAADDDTKFKMVQRIKNYTVECDGLSILGNEPREKWHDAQLLVFLAERWYASEWMFNIMSDA